MKGSAIPLQAKALEFPCLHFFMINWYIIAKAIIEKNKDQILDEIKRFGPSGKEYPGDYDSEVEKSIIFSPLYDFLRRDKFVSEYSWAVPSEKSINYMKQFIGGELALELGSGNGLWAKLLKDSGLNIIPTDPAIWSLDSTYNPNKEDKYIEVEKINHIQAIEKYHDANILIFIWPSYDENYAAEAVELFSGNKIIYIGEGKNGCTANDRFHELLDDEWRLVYSDGCEVNKNESNKSYEIDRWTAIYDKIFFYIRIKK